MPARQALRHPSTALLETSLWETGRPQKHRFPMARICKETGGHTGQSSREPPTLALGCHSSGVDWDNLRASLHTAWHLGQWPLLRQRALLVQPIPGCPLPELYRFLPRGTTPCGQLPPAEDHREGQLRQSQAGPAYPDGSGGECG